MCWYWLSKCFVCIMVVVIGMLLVFLWVIMFMFYGKVNDKIGVIMSFTTIKLILQSEGCISVDKKPRILVIILSNFCEKCNIYSKLTYWCRQKSKDSWRISFLWRNYLDLIHVNYSAEAPFFPGIPGLVLVRALPKCSALRNSPKKGMKSCSNVRGKSRNGLPFKEVLFSSER